MRKAADMLKFYPKAAMADFKSLAEQNWKSSPVQANLPWGLSLSYLEADGLYRMLILETADGPDLVGVQTEANRPMILTGPASIGKESVAKIRGACPELPGLIAQYDLARSFLTHWAEEPDYSMVMYLYQLDNLQLPAGITGHLLPPGAAHEQLLAEWLKGFATDVKETGASEDYHKRAKDMISSGSLYLYEEADKLVSMAGSTRSAGGVACINYVYTPPQLRGRGYGTKCVGLLCQQLMSNHDHCCLYAEEDNPISNHVYRKLGFYVDTRSLEVSWSR